MPKLVLANTATAAYRRVYFDLRQSDGLTPATSEAGGQPQISTDGGAWTDTGIGTLTSIGQGRYYADLTQTAVLTAGTMIETRYKSSNTIECPGDSIHVVAFNPHDSVRIGITALPNAAATTSGGLPTVGTGSNQISLDGSGNVAADVREWVGSTPNSLVSGRVDTTVGAMQTDVVTATAIAADAIGSSELAATAAAEIADAVWDEAASGHVTAGTFGEQCGTDIDAILVDTGTTLDGRIPAALVGGRMDANMGAISTDSTAADNLEAALDGTGGVTITATFSGNLSGSVGSLDTQAKADVNTEVVDALFTDTISQLSQGQPSATPTIAQALMLLYMALRNAGTTTATSMTIANSSGTVICKATLSDDTTTFTKAVLVSGP